MASEPVRWSVPALLVTLLLAGCADPGPADPAGRPTAVVSDASSAGGLAHAALLPASELGPGWRQIDGTTGTPQWPWAQDDCPGYRDGEYPAQDHRNAAVQRGYTDDSSMALHVVEEYQPGWGRQAMADARQVLDACPSYPVLGGQVDFTLLPEDRGKTGGARGEESLVVRGRIERVGSPATISYFISVRRDDTVSTLNLPDPGTKARLEAVIGALLAHLGRAG